MIWPLVRVICSTTFGTLYQAFNLPHASIDSQEALGKHNDTLKRQYEDMLQEAGYLP